MAIFEITIDQGSLNEQNEKKKRVSSEFSLVVKFIPNLSVQSQWYAPFTVASHIKSNCH